MKRLLLAALSLALLSGISRAETINLSVSGASVGGTTQVGGVSGPNVSVHFESIDNSSVVFYCSSNPCAGNDIPWGPLPVAGWYRSDGCVYDQCSQYIAGGFMLTLDPFDISSAFNTWTTLQTTGTIAGFLAGGPFPYINHPPNADGMFSISGSGRINASVYGVSFADGDGIAFASTLVQFTGTIDADVAAVPEPSSLLLLLAGVPFLRRRR